MIDTKKPILLFGGHGVIGNALRGLFIDNEYDYIAPEKNFVNLLDYKQLTWYLDRTRPKYIINLAAVKTNIQINAEQPATICTKTMEMNLNLLKACVEIDRYRPKKLINIISSCAYGQADLLIESDFLKGEIHPSVKPHGEAKRMVYLFGKFYRAEYKLNVVTACFNNIFGGSNWSRVETLKVLDSMVRKIVDARESGADAVTFWGTGKPRREFLYHKNAADGLLQVLEKYDDTELINVGSGQDINIGLLANWIARLVKYEGRILWDETKPDGQLVKRLNCDKMHDKLKWFPPTTDEDAILETISSYEEYLRINK